MLKDLLKFKDDKPLDVKYPIKITDSRGNLVYLEDSTGCWTRAGFDSNNNYIYFETSDNYWYKQEFNSNGYQSYFEDSVGNWHKSEYSSNGKEIYFEDSLGNLIDKRQQLIKELSVKEIEKLLGYSIKIIKD